MMNKLYIALFIIGLLAGPIFAFMGNGKISGAVSSNDENSESTIGVDLTNVNKEVNINGSKINNTIKLTNKNKRGTINKRATIIRAHINKQVKGRLDGIKNKVEGRIKEKIVRWRKYIKNKNELKIKHIKLIRKFANETKTFVNSEIKSWKDIRTQYLAGKINEFTYFNRTQDMILTVIENCKERLSSYNLSSELIEELNSIEEEVLNCQTIDELRSIYPKVKINVRSANRAFAHAYIVELAKDYKYKIKNPTLQAEIDDVISSNSTNIKELVQKMKRVRVKAITNREVKNDEEQ